MKTKLIMAIVGLLVVGGGVFFFVNKDSDDKGSQTSQTNTNTSNQTEREASGDAPKLLAQTVGKDADCSTYSFGELTGVWGVAFTDTDINKVTGLSTAGGKQYECTYNQTNSGEGLSVVVAYREHPSVDSAKQSIADTRSTVKFGDTVYYVMEEKTGVGDEAFLWAKNRTDGSKEVNQQLYVRKDNVVFLLSSVNLDGVDASYKDKLVATYKLHFD